VGEAPGSKQPFSLKRKAQRRSLVHKNCFKQFFVNRFDDFFVAIDGKVEANLMASSLTFFPRRKKIPSLPDGYHQG
jgi:hypothetical protein